MNGMTYIECMKKAWQRWPRTGFGVVVFGSGFGVNFFDSAHLIAMLLHTFYIHHIIHTGSGFFPKIHSVSIFGVYRYLKKILTGKSG